MHLHAEFRTECEPVWAADIGCDGLTAIYIAMAVRVGQDREDGRGSGVNYDTGGLNFGIPRVKNLRTHFFLTHGLDAKPFSRKGEVGFIHDFY